MKSFIFVLLTAVTLLALAPAPLTYVDPERFSGLWYEIARTENRFEKECVAATVEYRKSDSEAFEVFNRCFRNVIGGERIEYHGSATPMDDKNFATIDMTYYWIFTKRYAVIYLDADYRSAVVADREMEQLWIMSRTPMMEKTTLDSIVSLLENYMDTRRLIWTPQDPQGRYQ